jgi:hypothetical protein
MVRDLTRCMLALALAVATQACGDDSTTPDAAPHPDAAPDRAPDTAMPDGGADASPDGATPDAAPADGNVAPDGGGAVTFKVKLENVAPFAYLKSGTVATAVGAAAAGPIGPGQAFEFTFTAGKGHKLSFAAMFGQSNDWFFGFDPGGLDLYAADGTPVSGDVTSHVSLWNAGTEVDEEPAVGPHTGPKQATSTDGPGAPDPDSKVRKVPAAVTLTAGGTFNVPATAAMIKVVITPSAATRQFLVHIENASTDGATLMTSQGWQPVRISPLVWAVTTGGDPFFTDGMADRGKGLENIAESGDIAPLAATLPPLTGVATGISPGVWVIHGSGSPLYAVGMPDRGMGLENIAESGNIVPLSTALMATLPAGATAQGLWNTPVGASAPGPAGPGASYEFSVTARPGDRLSFVTMYGWSNDWFFGTPDTGITLFDAGGLPVAGDVTAMMKLFDAGTELSQEPAVGSDTGPQQASATQGPADSDPQVREVASSVYATPVSQHIRVTVSH